MTRITTAVLLFGLTPLLACRPTSPASRAEGVFFGPATMGVEVLARNRTVPGQPVVMSISAERWKALVNDIPVTTGPLPNDCSGVFAIPIPSLHQGPTGSDIEPPTGIHVTLPCVGPAPGDPTKSCFPVFNHEPGGGIAVGGCICLSNDEEGNAPIPHIGIEPGPVLAGCHLVVWPDSVRCRGTCPNGGRCTLIRKIAMRSSATLATDFIGCACLAPPPVN